MGRAHPRFSETLPRNTPRGNNSGDSEFFFRTPPYIEFFVRHCISIQTHFFLYALGSEKKLTNTTIFNENGRKSSEILGFRDSRMISPPFHAQTQQQTVSEILGNKPTNQPTNKGTSNEKHE